MVEKELAKTKKRDVGARAVLMRLIYVTAKAFGVKLGFNLLLRLLAVLRAKKGRRSSALNMLTMLVDVLDAKEFSMFIGGFAGLYKLVTVLQQKFAPKHNALSHAIAGLAAGAAVHLDPSRKYIFAIYILPRALQGLYNFYKEKIWPQGKDNTIPGLVLFCAMSAQVMYSYVMRPDALAESYHKFIVKSGPIPSFVLSQIRAQNRHQPLQTEQMIHFCSKMGGEKAKLVAENAFKQNLPLSCWALHPQTSSCTKQFATTWWGTFSKRFPLYLSLHSIATLLSRRKMLMQKPGPTVTTTLINTIRSDAFLASFCAFYMAIVCSHNKVFVRDHKFQYWFAGVVCSLSLLIEKKARRDELTLYVLPRGLEALSSLLISRRLLPRLPHSDLLFFSLSTAVIMHFYETNQKVLSPLLVKTIKPLII